MYKKGDIIKYNNLLGTPGDSVGVFSHTTMTPLGQILVWAYWGGQQSLTYVMYEQVILFKKGNRKQKNLPNWW
jgi:hypothetical protein